MSYFNIGIEEWVDIKDFEGLYQASSEGKIKNLITNKFIGFKLNGYIRVELSGKGVQVHRLIAQTFIDNIDNKPYVNHINGIKHDNRAINLEWVNASENVLHGHYIKNKNQIIPIIQKTKSGIFIKEYESIAKAQRAMNGKSVGGITDVLRDKAKTAYGFVWTYAKT